MTKKSITKIFIVVFSVLAIAYTQSSYAEIIDPFTTKSNDRVLKFVRDDSNPDSIKLVDVVDSDQNLFDVKSAGITKLEEKKGIYQVAFLLRKKVYTEYIQLLGDTYAISLLNGKQKNKLKVIENTIDYSEDCRGGKVVDSCLVTVQGKLEKDDSVDGYDEYKVAVGFELVGKGSTKHGLSFISKLPDVELTFDQDASQITIKNISPKKKKIKMLELRTLTDYIDQIDEDTKGDVIGKNNKSIVLAYDETRSFELVRSPLPCDNIRDIDIPGNPDDPVSYKKGCFDNLVLLYKIDGKKREVDLGRFDIDPFSGEITCEKRRGFIVLALPWFVAVVGPVATYFIASSYLNRKYKKIYDDKEAEFQESYNLSVKEDKEKVKKIKEEYHDKQKEGDIKIGKDREALEEERKKFEKEKEEFDLKKKSMEKVNTTMDDNDGSNDVFNVPKVLFVPGIGKGVQTIVSVEEKRLEREEKKKRSQKVKRKVSEESEKEESGTEVFESYDTSSLKVGHVRIHKKDLLKKRDNSFELDSSFKGMKLVDLEKNKRKKKKKKDKKKKDRKKKKGDGGSNEG